MEKDFKVDLVYLWVDGSDPQWLAKKNACQPDKLNVDAAAKGRFFDNDELKFSLRSVEKFAPWVNKIFIVTDNQTPKWLNKSHPKIQIVDHTEIMPRQALPNFNSNAIETRLPYIEGLSEHFLFANDDMFFAAPVDKDFFFCACGRCSQCRSAEAGRAGEHISDCGMPVVRFEKNTIKKNPGSLYGCKLKNAQELIFKTYGVKYKNFPHHNIDAYLKSEYLDCIKKFEKELEPTTLAAFRDKSHIQRIVFSFYMLAAGRAHSKIVDAPWFCPWREVDSLVINMRSPGRKQLKRLKPKLFCVNDDKKTTDEQRLRMKEFLQTLFGEKSEFEL